MDLDYRALSNAGLWCLGRLQTDADRDRVSTASATKPAKANPPKSSAESSSASPLAGS